MRKSPFIKVCGLVDHQNMIELSALPIHYMGHIFYPKSPRYADKLTDWIPKASIKKTGVFVNANFEEIISAVAKYRLSTIQLHGAESPVLCDRLKDQDLEVIKAFGIDEQMDWSVLEAYAPRCDYFLFDSKSKQYGGTGQTFDWQKLRTYPLEVPYFLSGGISLENLQEALTFPDQRIIGLDLNSRFEISPGIKDIEKIKLALKVINHE